MYVPPIQAFCYILRYSVSCFRLKWTPVDKLTQTLSFNIPFISTFMIITDREQGVHLLEDRTHTYPQYRHFAIYYCIRLAFLDSNGHQLTN